MSSILKALKRVEEESTPLQSYQSPSGPIDSKQALSANTKKRWHLRRLTHLLLILILVCGGVTLVFSQREILIAGLSFMFPPDTPTDNAQAKNRTDIYRAKIPAAAPVQNQTQPKTVSRLPEQTQTSASTVRDKKFQSRSTSGKQRSAGRTVVPHQKQPGTRSRVTPKAKVVPPPRQTPTPSVSASLNKTKPRNRPQAVRPAAERPQPVRPKPRRTYDRINDDNLRLQALAWADDAARRMAVINGRIVHEGESVDGYQILKIREEDVIIQQSGKSWRLEFGLQH